MILVTGGAGFIGSNFVLDWLRQSDEPVINLDALFPGRIVRAPAAEDAPPTYNQDELFAKLPLGALALVASIDSALRAMAQRVEVSGETVFFYTSTAPALLQALQAHPQLRTLHRPANLEDLFLKLTGRQIREEG